MFPIFAAIGAALAAAIGPVAKAVALAAVGGAAAFGTNKLLTVVTQKDPPKPALGDAPKGKADVSPQLALGKAQAYLPEPLMTRVPCCAPLSPVARL